MLSSTEVTTTYSPRHRREVSRMHEWAYVTRSSTDVNYDPKHRRDVAVAS